MSELELLQKRIERERTARRAAEQLLEDKSLALYLSNKSLKSYSDEVAEQKEQLLRKVEELQQTRSQLVQSEKMAAVGQLAAGIAHEINNPVGFISSNLGSLNEYLEAIQQVLSKQAECIELMSKAGSSGEEATRELEQLKKQVDLAFILSDIDQLMADSIEGAHRLKCIVADLSDFSHIDGPELVKEDINQLLDKTINFAWNELKYKADVKKEFGDIPSVLCNGGKLGQAFLNLLINAAQAIESTGVITVRTGKDTDSASVWITIEDTGPGVPEHIVNKIFDPFFTTKDVGKGTGLGLHMVQNVIDSHGGIIAVSSEVGKGTVFRLTLPICLTVNTLKVVD